jgi:tRNA modification GTPase
LKINCHGSEIVVSLLLRLICKNGARLAEPGEYSKRAFMNGKLDLSEAEAIMDIVNASTKQAAKIAVKQLTGRLKDAINSIKEELTDLLSEVEVYIDYPEEDIYLDIDKWTNQALAIKNKSEVMLKDFSRGKYLREGILAAILGKTNAGKSTLFNYLLNEDKAIVSDIHGTTRDYLDGVINVSGYGVRVYDTAGLRKTEDPIELEGTKRAIDISDKSDIIIYVIGADNGVSYDDNVNISSIRSDKKVLFIINKTDLTDDNGSSLLDKINEISEGEN